MQRARFWIKRVVAAAFLMLALTTPTADHPRAGIRS